MTAIEHDVSVGERALGALLDASHTVAPDDVAALLAETGESLGLHDLTVFLVDYEQRTLMPLPRPGVTSPEPLDIDATLAGRAFRTLAPVSAPTEGGHRLWQPLLDGTSRLGVLGATLDDGDERTRDRCRHLASVAADLIVTREAYGDVFVLTRRRRPVSLAAEMQWSLLPPLTYATHRVVISAMLEPSYEVAGDTFDYAHVDGVAHFAIIDAMGHGFEATRMASVAVHVYRHCRRRGLDLEATRHEMDAVIAETFGPDRFLTAQLARLHVDSGRLRWLNAGHPTPLLLRNGKVVGDLACEPTLPIGFGGATSEIATEALEPGDRLLFFTDGVIEARDAQGAFFGRERLADLLVRAAGAALPMPETLRRLGHAILDHQDGTLQDDATTLVIEWLGPQDATDPLDTGPGA